MPPKENAKSKKEREKMEKFAQQQSTERLDEEIAEDQARREQELQEKLERDEIYIEFYQILVNPVNRLMVSFTAFAEMRNKMQKDGASSASRILSMQEEMYKQQKFHQNLQKEMVHLRAENRALSAKVGQLMEEVSTTVDRRLTNCIDSVEGSILRQREDCAETLYLLNRSLEESKHKALRVAEDALFAANRVTKLMQENTSMHSKIPHRIRTTLQGLEKEELLLMLDTLSFDEPALQYLLYRYPPSRDDPFQSSATNEGPR